MPIIVTTRPGTCRACGLLVRRGEYADFSAAEGLSHPEPTCSKAPVRFRPNRRAGRCACGTHVPASKGRLLLHEDRGASGGGKTWGVQCARCAGL